MNTQHIDREKNPPTFNSGVSAAWEIEIQKVYEATKTRKGAGCAVALWVVFAPWAHPHWAYYSISTCHLRDESPEAPKAKIHLPSATHEIIVAALDPQRVPNLTNPLATRLEPINFAGQWIAQARPNPVDLDLAAAKKTRETVEEIMRGELSPDTDFIGQWVARFSESNLR